MILSVLDMTFDKKMLRIEILVASSSIGEVDSALASFPLFTDSDKALIRRLVFRGWDS
jgi:hypothetical protein